MTDHLHWDGRTVPGVPNMRAASRTLSPGKGKRRQYTDKPEALAAQDAAAVSQGLTWAEWARRALAQALGNQERSEAHEEGVL